MIEEFVKSFFHCHGSDQIALLNSVTDYHAFSSELISNLLSKPSAELIQLLSASLTLHSNKSLYIEVGEYFGMPLLKQLSEVRLSYEIANNDKLSEFVSVQSRSEDFLQKSSFLPSLVKALLPRPELHPHFLNLVTVLLLQPSLRRFVKPFLEDSLVLQQFHFDSLTELDRIWHYPINEFTGVYFESPEEHFQSRFAFIQQFHSELLKSGRMSGLAKLSTIELVTCALHLRSLTVDELTFILNLLHCGNFPKDMSKESYIQAVVSLLSCPTLNEPSRAFDPLTVTPVLPLTIESLSFADLLDRHYRLLKVSVR